MSNLLYDKKTTFGRLFLYFTAYFSGVSAPTVQTLVLFLLSMLALESADSVRFIFKHFMARVWYKSLNSLYYAISYAKVDHAAFLPINARLALGCVPCDLATQPVFICIDDTMVEKFGKKFECVSKLFDHAAHNGSNYLNGHCFVSLSLQVPVWKHGCPGVQICPIPADQGAGIFTQFRAFSRKG